MLAPSRGGLQTQLATLSLMQKYIEIDMRPVHANFSCLCLMASLDLICNVRSRWVERTERAIMPLWKRMRRR